LALIAQCGNFHNLKYAFEKLHFTFEKYVLEYAASSGSLKCLVYTYTVICKDMNPRIYYGSGIINAAIRSGNIKCLIYAHKVIKATKDFKNTLFYAIKYGNNACVAYCRNEIGLTEEQKQTSVNYT
jgi:hypothetical protein